MTSDEWECLELPYRPYTRLSRRTEILGLSRNLCINKIPVLVGMWFFCPFLLFTWRIFYLFSSGTQVVQRFLFCQEAKPSGAF